MPRLRHLYLQFNATGCKEMFATYERTMSYIQRPTSSLDPADSTLNVERSMLNVCYL
jgi:hypothetical protein